MPASVRITRDQACCFRLSAHYLDRRLPVGALTEAAAACGIQDTPPGSAALALAARLEAFSTARLAQALEVDKSLLLLRSMRSAPHLVPTADAAVFTAGLLPANEEELRFFVRGASDGLDRAGIAATALVELAAAALLDALDRGPVPFRALSSDITERVAAKLPTGSLAAWHSPGRYAEGQSLGEALVHFALYLLALRGLRWRPLGSTKSSGLPSWAMSRARPATSWKWTSTDQVQPGGRLATRPGTYLSGRAIPSVSNKVYHGLCAPRWGESTRRKVVRTLRGMGKNRPGRALRSALAVFLLLASLAGCAAPGAAGPGAGTTAGPSPAASEMKGSVALRPCQIGRTDSATRMAAKCSTVPVYEDREALTGRRIDLRVAVISAISRSPAKDPLFFITGGPGEAATDDYPNMAAAFRRINEKRDIVLVDQRGTGGSHPLLCLQAAGAGADSTEALAAACVKEIDGDPRFYNTLQAIGDLDEVRAALGYDKINLYGVSYGTRVAQSYLARYPDRVRSIILDGILPQDASLGLTLSSDAQAALDKIWLRCAADAACRTAYPDVRSEFTSLMARVEGQPAQLTISDPRTAASTMVTFGRSQLALAVRLFSYQTETTALLPMLIHNAATAGDLEPLAAQSLIVQNQLEGGINIAMHNSVVCAEDVPFYTAPGGGVATDAGRERQGYLGEPYKDLQQLCATWPAATVPASFKQLVKSGVPALLFSGELDPVTPPANGERVAAGLPNSLHLVAPGTGHGVMMRGCGWRVASAFIEKGSVSGLDTACFQQMQPSPFFTSATGPS